MKESRITKHEDIVTKLIHHTTPSSSGKTRKKPKSRSHEILFLQQSSEDSDTSLPPTQLDMLLANNTSNLSEIPDNTNISVEITNSPKKSAKTSQIEDNSSSTFYEMKFNKDLDRDPDNRT